MSKKVVVISTSIRANSNSEVLAKSFVDGASDAGNEVEFIMLKDKKIDFCKGCLVCQQNGNCIIKDDVTQIMDKVIDADIVVWATPKPSMKRRIFHCSTFIAYLILAFCLTACAGRNSENLQETNDTTMHENTTSESQVEIQNDAGKSEEYTSVTVTIENTDEVSEDVGMKLYINDTEIPVSWEENDTIEELVEQAKSGDIIVSFSLS